VFDVFVFPAERRASKRRGKGKNAMTQEQRKIRKAIFARECRRRKKGIPLDTPVRKYVKSGMFPAMPRGKRHAAEKNIC
jgi:hypothetical protein